MLEGILSFLIICTLCSYTTTTGIALRQKAKNMYVKYKYETHFRGTLYSPSISFLVTLTSSPKRLASDEIYKVFDSVSNASTIVLNLPKLFHNVEPYDTKRLEQLQTRYSNLSIHWIEKDLGPQLKLLGCLPILDKYLDHVVIVIDDDTVYSNKLFQAYENVMLAEYDQGPLVYSPSKETIFDIQVCPGYASYAIAAETLLEYRDTITFKAQEYSRGPCNKHDDFVFAAIFEDLGLKIKSVPWCPVLQLDYGFQSDALCTTELSVVKHLTCSNYIKDVRDKTM
jgi:hypothetical protein